MVSPHLMGGELGARKREQEAGAWQSPDHGRTAQAGQEPGAESLTTELRGAGSGQQLSGTRGPGCQAGEGGGSWRR